MIPFGQLLLMSPKEYAAKGGASLAGQGNNRWCELTRDQMRTFITQRAMAASPLMAGGDLPTLDAFSLGLLTNREMLACNQNGVTGMPVWEQDGVEVWHTPDRAVFGNGWLAIFNRNQAERTVTTGAQQMALDPSLHYALAGIWSGEKSVLREPGRAWRVPADGVEFLRFTRQPA